MARYVSIRLTSDEANRERIKKFRNPLNRNLEDYLKYDAWADDLQGANAVYVVLDNDCGEEIVMYFALKSGMLSSPFSADIYELLDANNDELLDEMPAEKAEALEYIKEFLFKAERDSEINKVAETSPGIELSQFCVNVAYRRKMREIGVDTRGLGAYFFHAEVYPIVRRIQGYIGCQFLYLFAADSSEDGSLISYYRDVLGFLTLDDYDPRLTNDREVIPIMPYYDYQCKFMFLPL